MPKLHEVWKQVRTFLSEGMWRAELQPRTWTARGIALLQFAVMVGEGFIRDRLLLRSLPSDTDLMEMICSPAEAREYQRLVSGAGETPP